MTQAVEGDHETILPGPAQLHHTLDVESDGTFWRYPTKITDFRDNDSVFFGRNGEFTKVYLWIEWDLTNEKNGIWPPKIYGEFTHL